MMLLYIEALKLTRRDDPKRLLLNDLHCPSIPVASLFSSHSYNLKKKKAKKKKTQYTHL